MRQKNLGFKHSSNFTLCKFSNLYLIYFFFGIYITCILTHAENKEEVKKI